MIHIRPPGVSMIVELFMFKDNASQIMELEVCCCVHFNRIDLAELDVSCWLLFSVVIALNNTNLFNTHKISGNNFFIFI